MIYNNIYYVSKMMVIAISGTRCVGKDTMFTCLNKINSNIIRFAFADMLKYDLQSFIKTQFNIDALNPSPSEKELIRPIFIAYGNIRREQDVDYWVKKVLSQFELLEPRDIPCIVDLRFPNELELLRKQYGTNLIHINLDRINSPKPTTDEAINIPILARLADSHFVWGKDSPESRLSLVNQLYRNKLEPIVKSKF